ncbi:MAG: NAD(P)H-dependent oxidoreductase, partial [bacterium]
AIVSTIVKADLLVLLTPITFGGYSSELKKLLDRAICLVSPFFMKVQGETHHTPRYESLPRLLGVGVASGCDIECQKIFKTLVQRNALNLHAPACSAAVVDGTGSDEEIRSEILDSISDLGVLQ